MHAIIGKNKFVILSELNPQDIYKIAVVMGSDSDLKTLKPAVDILREFGIKTEVFIWYSTLSKAFYIVELRIVHAR